MTLAQAISDRLHVTFRNELGHYRCMRRLRMEGISSRVTMMHFDDESNAIAATAGVYVQLIIQNLNFQVVVRNGAKRRARANRSLINSNVVVVEVRAGTRTFPSTYKYVCMYVCMYVSIRICTIRQRTYEVYMRPFGSKCT